MPTATAQLLVVEDRHGGHRRQLLVARYDADPHRNLTNLVHPLFAPSGTALYLSSADAAPASGAAHRIDLASGKLRFAVPGSAADDGERAVAPWLARHHWHAR